MEMEIRHLQTFVTIAELGSFTKAAEYLGYAQSTITSHIQILENELGDTLFDRLGKKIILTNVGKELLPYARKMLNVYKDIKNITADPKCVSGDLVIGAGESLSVYRLGKILKEYKKNYPKVNIILKNSTCSDLRRRLYSGEMDIIFTIEPEIMDKDLIVKKLKDEVMVIIGEPGADFEFLNSSSENQEAKENIIFSEKGCSFRISFENYLKNKNINYFNPLEFASVEATKKCVMNSLGISILPLYAVKNEVEEGKLKILELMEPFEKYSTQLSYHKNKSISVAMSRFIEITLKNSKKWK